MTLHASKGLEFDAVFIPGCEQGLLPYALFANQQSDIAEEQRLLYVGMTRAKKRLFLSHADSRFLLGKEYNLPRSPFLDRIEQELLEQREQKPGRRRRRLQRNNSRCSEMLIAAARSFLGAREVIQY